jgi:hypothetical protein
MVAMLENRRDNGRLEKPNRFDFSQFRFVVAGILLLAAGLKAYQLATAPLPPVVKDSVFTPLLELLNDRYLLMTVVVSEILFALVLISGLWRQWAWLLSLLCFSAFALVSMMKGLSGEASCGCFGPVTVNPRITAVLDLVIVGCLVVFRPEKSGAALAPRLDRKKLLAVLVAWFVLAGLALFAMLSLKQQPHETLGTQLERFDSRRMIHLAPEKWIDKEFPLFSRFAEPEGSEILRQRAWNVLLVHADCPDCSQMMKDLEERKPDNVAIVVLPSPRGDRLPQTSFPTFMLDDQVDWYAITPRVVKLSEGICVAVGEKVDE